MMHCRPRVLVLTSTFPRWNDDTEPRFVLDLCRYLSQAADILVVAPHTPGALAAETLESVRVLRFQYFIRSWQTVAYEGGISARLSANPWRILQLPFFFIAMWRAARRALKEWRPDVIHAHWIVPQGLIASLAVNDRLPILCTSHGSDLHGLQSPFFNSLKSWTLRRCAAVTVVGEGMLEKAKRIAPRTPVSQIPMGTDLASLFTPPRDPGSRSRNEIVFVGRLVEKKGLNYLLEAFAILLRQHGNLTLTIVGDGPLRPHIEESIRKFHLDNHVRLTGALRQRELPGVFRRAVFAVFPFLEEGFGLAIVEAMGCGCPVVASDLPATRQTIDPGITGFLAPPGNAAMLAEAMNVCLGDRRMRSMIADSALEAVRNNFAWPHVAKQYARIIESLVER